MTFQPDDYDNVDDLLPPTPRPESKWEPNETERRVISLLAISIMTALGLLVVGILFFILIWVGRWSLGG